MAATVITIAVEKGGCGKTVTTSNLAYLMGDEGKKVLCLDTDPQGNLTFALTGGNAITSKAFANRSLYDMIDGFRYNTQTRDFIVESEYENVDLIPANDQTPRLSKRLEDLYTDAQRDYDRGDPKYLASDTDVLDYFLRQVKDEYDYILIDTQPSRDSLLLSNAIAAADYDAPQGYVYSPAAADQSSAVTVDDETGAPIRFQHLATIEHEGELYIALSEADAPEDGQCEVFIMQVAQEEDGTESYIQVEDEAVQQAVFDKFLQLVNEGSGDDE